MELQGKAEYDRRSHLCTSTGIAGEEESSCKARSELSVRISERRMQYGQLNESEGDHRDAGSELGLLSSW